MLKTFELFLRNLLIHMILNENVGNSLSCRTGSLEMHHQGGGSPLPPAPQNSPHQIPFNKRLAPLCRRHAQPLAEMMT